MLRRAATTLVALATGVVLLAGCAPAEVTLPPEGAAPDYQLGGAYAPAPNVGILVRDRTAEPLEGVYSVCYINAFQTQRDELDDWPEDVLLHGSDGEVVTDPVWPDEALVDTSTDENRAAMADAVGPWIVECAASGFDAVEFDNLDSYARSDGALSLDDNIALATVLVDTAHAAGLAAAQKNTAEESATLRNNAHFDFAIAEECAQRDQCSDYVEVYGEHVMDIEYIDNLEVPFDQVCADPSTPASVVLRDRALSTPDEPDFTFALCPSEE